MRRHEFTVPGFESEKPDRQKRELQRIFRRVFSTGDGALVLNVLLSDLRYYRPAESEADTALCEYAKKLLRERLGISDTEAVTKCLLDSIKEKN